MEQERSDEEKLKWQQDQPQAQPQPPEIQTAVQNHRLWQSPQKCPSCDSSNIKFCYYNNYSLSQPRYFCKACRRYWTHGGTLRNVLVGGDRRQKSKRLKPSSSGSEIGRTQSVSTTLPSQALTVVAPAPPLTMSMGTADTGGSFWYSLLTNNLPAGINQTRRIPPRPLTFLPQSLINRGPTTASSAASSSLWSGATADGSDNQASSSVDPNHWADNVPGFDPSPRT